MTSWMDKPVLSSTEVCELFGLTYRQLMHRVSAGYIAPVKKAHGSGYSHMWSLRNIVEIATFEADVKRCPMKH